MSHPTSLASSRPRAISIASVAGMALAIGAVASIPSESSAAHAKPTKPAKTRGGKATTTTHVQHHKGVVHGSDDGSGVVILEAWRDFSVARRWHFKNQSTVRRISTVQEWNTPQVDIIAKGAFSVPVAKRVKAGKSTCKLPLSSTLVPVVDPRTPFDEASMRRELALLQYVEQLRHDDSARFRLVRRSEAGQPSRGPPTSSRSPRASTSRPGRGTRSTPLRATCSASSTSR